MRRLVGLAICSLLVGCDREQPEDSKPSAAVVATLPQSNSLPTLPPIVLDPPQPSLVDTILQEASSHAQVSFATNSEGVECTLTSQDRDDRLRIQGVVTRMFGSCKGTVDPPTVTFRLQPLPMYPPAARVHVTHPAADDIQGRLQQRWEYEKARDAKEIHDLQAEIYSDEGALLTIRNSAVAYGQAEIVRAKKLRLKDLRDFYLTKYKEYP